LGVKRYIEFWTSLKKSRSVSTVNRGHHKRLRVSLYSMNQPPH